jgi:peptidoglycan/xylan/chitin deacetylase (PgdA/CDA1 family)
MSARRVAIAGWPDGKRAAVIFNVAYEAWEPGGSPGISPMGNPLPPGVPDTQAQDWVSYGWKSGIWRLMDRLERHGVRATVFTSGRLAEIAPDSIRALAQRGHDVCGHGYAQNVLPVMLSEDDERAQIADCKKRLEALVDGPVRGWVSPRGTPSGNTRRLLAEAGFEWHGDCFDSDFAYVETVGSRSIVAVPLAMEVNDLPVHLRHGNPPRALLDVFTEAFEAALEFDDVGHVDVTVHAHVFGRPYGARVLEEIIRRVTSRADVWVTTRSNLARWVLAGVPA